MMERDRDGEPTTPEVRRAEQEADRLAFELLAPIESVNRAIAAFSTSDRLDGATAILQDVYGLPAVQAAQYASLLAPPLPDSQTRRWGFA